MPIPNPTINSVYFPNTKGGVCHKSIYWTATTTAFDPNNAWAVEFGNGSSFYPQQEGRARDFGVRLVRGTPAMADFVVHENNTVTDNTTGLMWAQCSVGQSGLDCVNGAAIHKDWQQALVTANTSTLGGFDDWRLPNLKELRSLVNYTEYNPSIEYTIFPRTPSQPVWTATPYANIINASWCIDLDSGKDKICERDEPYVVRLVRTVQSASEFPLAVNIAGIGSGSITSEPAGINCAPTTDDTDSTKDNNCTAKYPADAEITLVPVASKGSIFAGWKGACTGSDICTVTMRDQQNVTATFDLPLNVAIHAIKGTCKTISAKLSIADGLNKALTGLNIANLSSITLDNDELNDCTLLEQKNIDTDTNSIASDNQYLLTCSTTTCDNQQHKLCVDVVDASHTVTGNTCKDYTSNIPEIIISSADDITATTATLNGRVIPNGHELTVSLDFGTSDTYGTNIVVTPDPITTKMVLTNALTDLTCGTTYHYRVKATSGNNSFYSADQQFTTAACPAELAVTITGNGTGNVTSTSGTIDCGKTCNALYNAKMAKQVTLSATAKPGNVFAGWSGACTGNKTCVISMTKAQNVTATFNTFLNVLIHNVKQPCQVKDLTAYISVTDSLGIALKQLNANNFGPIEIDSVKLTDCVVTIPQTTAGRVILVLDRSGSMRGRAFVRLKAAAIQFVNSLNATDQAAIYSFSSTITRDQDWTSDKALLIKAINSLKTGGRTSMYSAVHEATDYASTVTTGNPAQVITMTDGDDTASSISLKQLQAEVKTKQVPVYTIGLGKVNGRILDNIATWTGAVYYYAPNPDALAEVYANISGVLSNQYVITCKAQNCDANPHKLCITATNANLVTGTGCRDYTAINSATNNGN
jgi:Mg-chelatase subunit ChlD